MQTETFAHYYTTLYMISVMEAAAHVIQVCISSLIMYKIDKTQLTNCEFHH